MSRYRDPQFPAIKIVRPVYVYVHVNPYSTDLRNFNFQPREVVSRYRDPQLQVTENLCYLRNSSPNIYQCFKIESIFYFLTTAYAGANKNTECLL